MKRKKTRPPQAGSGDIREVQEGLRNLPSGAGGYRVAEAARAVYDKAWELHLRFPQDAESSNAYIESQKRYHHLIQKAYPSEFGQELSRLGVGDASGLESIVAFLEADPIFYGTGYLKENLSRLLRDLDIPTKYVLRLQAVFLSIVDRRDGREFRAYCRLARKVDSPELRNGLTRQLTHTEPNVRRRARWVLEVLKSGEPKP